MKRLLAMSIALILTARIIACGNDEKPTEPTGPEADLVGLWTFEHTDFAEVMAQRITDFLVNKGLSRTEAEKRVYSEDFEESIFEENIRGLTLRFNEDTTWQDNYGGKGTWHVEENDLILNAENGTVIERSRYFLDGDDLALIFTKAQFLEMLRRGEDFDAESYESSNGLLDEDDVVRFFFQRKS